MQTTTHDEAPPPASAEPAEGGGPGDGTRGAGSTRLVAALAVLALLLLPVAVWTVMTQQAAAAREGDRSDAVAVARTAVVAMLTTDPATAEESFRRLTEIATGAFGQQLQGQSEGFVQAIQTAGVISRGTVSESAFVVGDEQRATVIVSADSVVQNRQVPEGEPRQYRMSLVLDKQGEQWLVSSLDFVP